jgi:TrmH family RNA methyltransferase
VIVDLEGFHALKHVLRFAPSLVRSVTVTSVDAAAQLCAELAPDVTDALLALASVGPVDHPTGVSGTAERPREDRSPLSVRTAPLVVLDDPRHPGNAGAAIRVAAAAGASGVAMTGALDPWHPAVVRGSAGLHYALPVLALPVLQVSLGDVVGPVVALDADGDAWTPLPNDAVLVVGSERAGLSPEARARADLVVALPMTAGVSSLNLATAVSAALYSWRLSRPLS